MKCECRGICAFLRMCHASASQIHHLLILIHRLSVREGGGGEQRSLSVSLPLSLFLSIPSLIPVYYFVQSSSCFALEKQLHESWETCLLQEIRAFPKRTFGVDAHASLLKQLISQSRLTGDWLKCCAFTLFDVTHPILSVASRFISKMTDPGRGLRSKALQPISSFRQTRHLRITNGN